MRRPICSRRPHSERRALVDLVIYAYDRTTSAGIRARLAEGLGAVGVAVLNPDGEPFDPTRHEAGGTEPTADPERNGLVAETELAGFVDRGAVIRDPVVVVYRMRPEPAIGAARRHDSNPHHPRKPGAGRRR